MLETVNKGEVLFYTVTGDRGPDILEAWRNGKRCRWFVENGDMTKSDRRGVMVADSMQVDIDGDFKTLSNMITATPGKHQATVQGVDYNLLSAGPCAMVRYCL